MIQKIKEEKKNEFHLDYVTSPGETLLDTINALGMSQTDLATRAGRHKKTINEVIKGKAPITPETAIQLEKILGVPASFWNNRQMRYNEIEARTKEYEYLKANVAYLDRFPIREMVKYGWFPKVKDKVEKLQNLLAFFGVASPEALDNYISNVFEPAYRAKTEFNKYSMAVWLRRGEMIAQEVQASPYDRARFQEIIPELRSLSRKEPSAYLPEIQKKCAAVGVVVVYTQELQGTKVWGATRWLNNGNPLIQLSLRYKKDDQFWFTFFHEVKHILQSKIKSIILDDENNFNDFETDEDIEADANRFAAQKLIPRGTLNRFRFLGVPTEEQIIEFAKEQEISPGIVVGQLQHYGKINWNSRLNKLKKTLEFPD